MSVDVSIEIEQLEHRIEELTVLLAKAKATVAGWVEANKSLSLSAAQARAENQGAGRGIFSGFMGSKFRSAMRAGAAASNASIAKKVAEERANISENKKQAHEIVRQIQAELTEAKQRLKALTRDAKMRESARSAASKAANDSLSLLQKLKKARDAGLLTDAEFEEKRKKIVAEL